MPHVLSRLCLVSLCAGWLACNQSVTPSASGMDLARPGEAFFGDLADPPDLAPECYADADCYSDTWCRAGSCAPWDVNPRGSHSSSGAPLLTTRMASCSGSDMSLRTTICNRGGVATAGVAKVTFYSGPGESKLCTAATSGVLAPGACEAVSCASAIPCGLWICAGDDGTDANHVCPRQSEDGSSNGCLAC